MGVILGFLSGLIFLNGVPHLVQGICGRQHMTPFARSSSALVNVIWGWINLIVGGLLGAAACGGQGRGAGFWVAFIIGGVATSAYLAVFWSNPNARLPWHKQ